MNTATTQEWQHDLTTSERELLREVALSLRCRCAVAARSSL
jgi:hypothetical protein